MEEFEKPYTQIGNFHDKEKRIPSWVLSNVLATKRATPLKSYRVNEGNQNFKQNMQFGAMLFNIT